MNSEEFTNDFINSIRDDKAANFQRRYRDVDVLLIDDIQFLQGKVQTQEEVEAILLEHLEDAYRRLMKRHHKAVENWDNPELTLHQREEYFHDMRKSAKKLRYAAEAVGAATRLKTKRLYNACKALQSSLGDFQDSVTSRDKLVQMASAARRRGEDTFGYGLLYQRERAVGLESLENYTDEVKAIRKAYKRLLKSVKKAHEKAAKAAKKKKEKKSRDKED